ncbi:MAG: spore coat protein [Tenericutes bacterium]|nr:spore coat protein [Mycoplasmatota bacterium]
MNNKEIKNSQKEVPSGIKMNDRDYLNSILELEKNMSNNYSIALNEASNDYLYEDYFSMLEDSKDMARELYNLMFKNGWYSLEEIDNTKLDNKINTLEQKLVDIGIKEA